MEHTATEHAPTHSNPPNHDHSNHNQSNHDQLSHEIPNHDMPGHEGMNHATMPGHGGHEMPGMDELAASGFDYSLAFIAGFLGSGHCLGMCGALVSGFFVKAGAQRSYLPYLLYQVARISVYTLVGMSAATLGVVLVSSGLLGKVQSIIQMVIGLVVVILALGILGWIPWQGSVKFLSPQLLRKGYAAANRKGPLIGALIAGTLNGLMPCPLTFAMAIKATSATSVLEGGALMLAFGAGTLPMMLFISVAFGKMSAKFRSRMMKAAALIMVFMGLNTLHKGAMFYFDEDFRHSTFLMLLHEKLNTMISFLHQALVYIGDMVRDIQGM